MASPRPPFGNQNYLPNGAQLGGQMPPQAAPLLPNSGRVVQAGGVRVLCVADVRGNLRSLNDLAKQANAQHVVHTGDFGFYDDTSLERIAEKTLRHVAQYSPLLSEGVKRQIQGLQPPHANLKQRFPPDQLPLSELPQFISGKYTLNVPVYTVWGACEDVRVLEKFRSGEYKIPNLHIIDEASSRLLEVGGIKLRLLGLGGAVVMHKLFDNGEGRTTIAGGQGTMWTTLLQMGELVDTANRVYDPTETRVFVTHASPAREGLLNQLSVTLKADFSVSAGLHFRYGSSYNEFSVNPTLDHYRGKLAASKASFNDVWETVKSEVQPAVSQNDAQQMLLTNALDIIGKMPTVANGGNPFGGAVPGQGPAEQGQVDEGAFKNMWNFNLADAAFGYLVLEIEAGRIGTEMRAQGFNFAHRCTSATKAAQGLPTGNAMHGSGGPSSSSIHGQTSAPPNQSAPQQPQLPRGGQQTAHSNQPPKGQGQATSTPAPVASQAKTITPQPQNTAINVPPASHAPANNGTTDHRNGSHDKPASQMSKPGSPAVEKKPSTGLFIHNLENEAAVRDLFPEEDKVHIVRIEKHGKTNHVVHFKSHEDAKMALERLPMDNKRLGGAPTPGQPRKANVKWYDDRGGVRGGSFQPRDGQQGAGPWQGSTRSGPSAGPRGGYQSGASDSEGARGRGGFNGRGRGRGGAGGERGGAERGGARGGRGSTRGNFTAKSASGGEDTSTSSAPAPTPAKTAPADPTSVPL